MALRPLPVRVGPQFDEGSAVVWMQNATDLINELVSDRAGGDGFAANVKTLLNALQATFQDGLLSIGTLAIDTTPEDFQTTTTAYYRIGSIQYSKTATSGISFTAAHPITASKYGSILVQINAAGTISTLIGEATQTTTQAYDSAAEAEAALPDPASGNVALGYITILATGSGWTANTDDMTDASDVTTATFNDGTPLTAFTGASLSDTIVSMSETGTLKLERG